MPGDLRGQTWTTAYSAEDTHKLMCLCRMLLINNYALLKPNHFVNGGLEKEVSTRRLNGYS